MKIIIKNKEIKIKKLKSIINKFKGLMFVKDPIDYGIVLVKCNSIHTFFMKQNIDICITDKNNKILYLKSNLCKNKIILPIKNGYYTYELPLDSVKDLNINEYLNIK